MTDEPRIDCTALRISSAVRASTSDDGLVLLDLQGGVVLASNAVGARIWELIALGLGCADIAAVIAHDYDVPIDRARHDVRSFLTALEVRGLVREEPGC